MKKEQLKKLIGYRIRIRPMARRPGLGEDLPQIDDDWRIERVDNDRIELSNVRTGHAAVLGLDHIHSFLTDPQRDSGGIKYGFLQLRIQLSLLPKGLEIEPLAPGDWGARKTVIPTGPTPFIPAPASAARLQTLITKLFQTGTGLTDQDVPELIYLMGELDGTTKEIIQSSEPFFMFERGRSPDGQMMDVEIWMYSDEHGRQRPIRAREAWEAARRVCSGTARSGDRVLLAAITQYFHRLKRENQKLVIKDVPEFQDKGPS